MNHYVIHKYLLEPEIDRIQHVFMPRKASILYVGEQNGELYLWAMHSIVEEDQKVARRIAVVRTGYRVPEATVCNYVGTVIMRDTYVWHVFDNGEVQ